MPLLASEESLIRTVDYVSSQGATWLLTAALLVCGSLALYLLRRILKESQDGRKELKDLNEKHIAVLEKSAIAQAENAAEVRQFGRQVTSALESSTNVIKGNTEAISDNTNATKQAVKSSEATTSALFDLQFNAEKQATDMRRQAEDLETALRRNTSALEDKEKKEQSGKRPPVKK